MAKGMDGIKKLSPDEVKKYRQVVLNYIGEKDKDKDEIKKFSKAKQFAPVLKKVDGLKLNHPKDSMAAADKPVEKNIDLEKSRQKEERDRLKEAILRQEEERRKIKQEDQLYKLRREQEEKERLLKEQEKINLEKEKVRQEKLAEEEKIKKQREQEEKERHEKEELIKQEKLKRLEEERQKKEIALKAEREAKEKAKAEEAKKKQEKIRLAEKAREEKRRLKENLRLEKIKRQEERKKIKHEIWLAEQQAAAKRKIKRQKAIRKFKKNALRKLGKIKLAVKQNFIFGVLILAVFLFITYLVFCLVVLRFGLNNKEINIFPVPAVVSNRGIISYQDFLKLKGGNYLAENYQAQKDYLAKWLILSNLKFKYGLAVNAPEEIVAEKFLADKNFNRVGLSRIKKISELLGVAEMGNLSKYADEYNEGIDLNAGEVAGKFGSAATALAIGQTSGIIYHDGYYLIKRIDGQNGRLAFEYLFIGANTLDKYLQDKLAKTKVFILAN